MSDPLTPDHGLSLLAHPTTVDAVEGDVIMVRLFLHVGSVIDNVTLVQRLAERITHDAIHAVASTTAH